MSEVSTPTTAWTVGDLGAFYTAHRSDIYAHAVRLLKDSNRANDVVQDVFLKFVLAAPEIENDSHALAYLHRSVEALDGPCVQTRQSGFRCRSADPCVRTAFLS